MMNNSYNINYSKIIFENGKLIEPSLERKNNISNFFRIKIRITRKNIIIK